MKSKIIVIEGLDSSGKETQSRLLTENLEKMGKTVLRCEFPNYKSPSSALVKIYAVDRVASFLQFWKNDYEDGTVILSDRYATSNIIYQMSKVDDSKRDEFIEWQNDFEYNKLGIPKPDAVIYLDVEPEVSQKLMEKRYGGDMSKMDLHERNVKFLLDCRKSALYAAEKCNWKVINCCENGDIKTIDKISEEIKEAIFDIL